MTARVVETHILDLTDGESVKACIWDNGTADIYIGETYISAAHLAEAVAFLEKHDAFTTLGAA